MKKAVVEIRDLAFSWPGHEPVLDLPALTISQGERVFIKGPSGSGKSTLIKAIAGSDPASSGQILLNGLDVYANFDSLRHDIGYVPQDDVSVEKKRLGILTPRL